MAKDFIKDYLLPIAMVISIAVTLTVVAMKSGKAEGIAEQKIAALTSTANKIILQAESNEKSISGIKEEQAFLKGVVTTKLDTLQDDVGEIKEQVLTLIKVD